MTSTFRHHLAGALLCCGAAALLAAPAAAGTSTDTLNVRVFVERACSVGGTTLDFGTYSSGQPTALDTQGNISFNNCGEGTLVISLDGGGGTINDRSMAGGGSQRLRYQLYRNSARNQVWGANGDALQQRLLVAGSGTIPIYGRILGGQDVDGGVYSDVVTITMAF